MAASEYSRLRSIARKRIERLSAAGFAPNIHIPTVKELKATGASMSRATESLKQFLSSGQTVKQARVAESTGTGFQFEFKKEDFQKPKRVRTEAEKERRRERDRYNRLRRKAYSMFGSDEHKGNGNDPVIPTSAQSDMLFDFNIGIFYVVPETFYISFSATSLLESKGKALEGKSSTSASFVGDRTFYLAAGYEYQFFNPMFKLNPSLMILSDVASTQYNLSSRLWYNNRMCFGVNYRYKESIGLLAGFTIKGVQINYAYDINIMGLKMPGSHEVSISYNFKLDLEKSPRIYRSIRYL